MSEIQYVHITMKDDRPLMSMRFDEFVSRMYDAIEAEHDRREKAKPNPSEPPELVISGKRLAALGVVSGWARTLVYAPNFEMTETAQRGLREALRELDKINQKEKTQ